MEHRIEVRRSELRDTRAVPDPDCAVARALDPGQARLRVSRFALTANNVTYAAFGEAMKYWQFFPASDPAWGCVPVWGHADVIESRADGVAVGERLYGYLPMGSHLVVTPARVGKTGFTDASAHREGLAAVYNRLERVGPDAGDKVTAEGLQALLRPLFTTSFLIDDLLGEAGFFGAHQLLLSSASSKTAWGTAMCLAQRPANQRPRVIGLTSARHVAALQALGCYDEVLAYEALDDLAAQAPSVYIDFAGDAGLRRRIHERWADRLRHSAAVGGAHWTELRSGAGLPGPRPTLFFAPAQVALRAAAPPAGWGPAGLHERIEAAWQAMLARAHAPGAPWLQLAEVAGLAACQAAWQRQLDGAADPRVGTLVRW